MLLLILSGAVLGCGALFIVSGAAKLYRFARRIDAGGVIRVALRISPRKWRWIELFAALAETCTGAAICADFHLTVAGAAMATQGSLFTAALAYARHTRATGGCACVRRSKSPDATIGWSVQIRAASLIAAGVIETAIRLPLPERATGQWFVIAPTAAFVLAAMVSAEQPWRTPRCHRRVWLPRRDTVRALMRHGVFEAMAVSAGPFADEYSHSRAGCVDEFRFTTVPAQGRALRAVSFRVSRTVPGGALAVEARLESAPG